jgi:hypothetical protein
MLPSAAMARRRFAAFSAPAGLSGGSRRRPRGEADSSRGTIRHHCDSLPREEKVMRSQHSSVYWFDTCSPPEFPQLAGELEVDVAIIGAGLVGVSAADAG